MNEYTADIISIGNELLAGYTTNTNASFIARELLNIGLPVNQITAIRDSHDDILRALSESRKNTDVVLITGGLGPTPDDITKAAICEFFETEIVFDEQVYQDVKRFLRERGRRISPANRDQALIPKCDHVIYNRHGTAPGLIFEKNEQFFIFMPGVPVEMKFMISDFVIDFLSKKLTLPEIQTRILRTSGIPEAKLYERIKDIMERFPQFGIAFLPRYIGVDMRFRIVTTDDSIQQEFDSFLNAIRRRMAKYIFSDREIEPEQALAEILTENKLTLAIAESFTGGLIADRITNIPGSSEYFSGSVVTYSNESKIDLLGVKKETIDNYGAVSEQTVREMLSGVRKKFNSSCAIASTGIAGPTGATLGKPVGLCYLAASCGDKWQVKKFQFGNDRILNKKRGAAAGIELLRRILLNFK